MKKEIKIIRTIYFDYDLFQEVIEISEKLKMSRSEFVNIAVKRYINSMKLTKIEELRERGV